jgi:hypothetical protein
MKQTIALVFLIYLSGLRPAIARDNPKGAGIGIEANFMRGQIYKHTANFKLPVSDNVNAYELNFLQQTYGKKPWHQRHGYPLVGVGITLTDYGMNDIYGKCIGIAPVLQLPLARYRNFEWTFKVAMGLGYITEKFERIPGWDTVNNAIGSHINNYTLFATDIRYRINKHWDVQAGLNFSHASNASFRRPNLGYNTYGWHIGLRYFPVTSQPERLVQELEPLRNRWLVQARFGIAGVEMTTADGPLYPVYMVSLYGSKRYLSKNKAFAGLDYTYNTNMYAFFRNNEVFIGKERSESWRSSAFIGNEFLMGRVGLYLQLGFYVKNYYQSKYWYYQKLGFNIYILQKEKGILKELFASTYLKAHGTEAEFAEFGIGFGF